MWQKHSQETTRRQAMNFAAFQIQQGTVYKNDVQHFVTLPICLKCCSKFFSQILLARLMVCTQELCQIEETAQTTKLTNDEENIICYVGGYILYKLPCKIDKIVRGQQVFETGLHTGVGDSSKLWWTLFHQ